MNKQVSGPVVLAVVAVVLLAIAGLGWLLLGRSSGPIVVKEASASGMKVTPARAGQPGRTNGQESAQF